MFGTAWAAAAVHGEVTRREFLSGAGRGVAVLALLPTAAPSAQSRMFVSLPPWAVARNVGWPEQARLAARRYVGYYLTAAALLTLAGLALAHETASEDLVTMEAPARDRERSRV